jgi:hypothetical protein
MSEDDIFMNFLFSALFLVAIHYKFSIFLSALLSAFLSVFFDGKYSICLAFGFFIFFEIALFPFVKGFYEKWKNIS